MSADPSAISLFVSAFALAVSAQANNGPSLTPALVCAADDTKFQYRDTFFSLAELMIGVVTVEPFTFEVKKLHNS